jgi:hypothetical protein
LKNFGELLVQKRLFKCIFLSLTIAIPFLQAADANSPDSASKFIYAIQGKAVAPHGVKDGWMLTENGRISAVGVSESNIPGNATKIKWDGYIFPGLIDTHNHIDWNSVPQWTIEPWLNRYEWQRDSNYKNAVGAKHDSVKPILDDSRKYGEIRALLGGTTLIEGSYTGQLPDLLVKNLDARYKALNYVPKLAEIKDEDRQKFLNALKNKSAPDGLQRLFFHIGEGNPKDAEARKEFSQLIEKGFGQKSVVVIHGLALSSSDFSRMRKRKMYLVWSPVSNWNLYRAVTNVPAAMKAGLVISLAPDWTISGSDNVLEEMKFAYAVGHLKWGDRLTAKDIF